MTLEKALALAELGMHVFPVANRDMADGHRIKDPLMTAGLKAGTTIKRRIEAMWSRRPDAWVGVWTGPSGIVVGDVDNHDGEADGRETIRDAGLEIPVTFDYGTLSGNGRHHIYAGPYVPSGKPFGPGKGVDRQSGDSYIIWYGPVPQSREQFAPAPKWLLENANPRREADKIDAQAFIAELPDEPMGRIMQQAYDRIPTTDFGRNDLFRRAREIAGLHFEGHKGAKRAFQQLAEEWLRGEFNTEEYRTDLLNSVGNAIGLAKSVAREIGYDVDAAPVEPLPANVSEIVEDRVVSWDELENTTYDVEWLLDGLISSNGLGLVTGRANVGKTTLAAQLGATLATGEDRFLSWEIPAARPRNVLFMSLELDGWGLQQFARPLGKSFDRALLGQHLKFWAHGNAVMLAGDEREQKRFIDRIEEAEPSVVLIDSLGEVCRNLQDENESADLFAFFKDIKNRYNTAVMIVHHHRKVSSENAGRSRRLNDLSDVYGSYNVTKQPDVILDVDDQRSSYIDPKAEVVTGEVALNLLKVRYSPKWKHPLNLHRDQNNKFSIDDTHHITEEEKAAVTGMHQTPFGLGAD